MNKLESSFDPEKKIWTGRKEKDVYNPKITLGEVLRFILKRNPKKIGQISANTNVELTNGEILLRSLKIASYLTQNWNLSHDEVVGVIARNTENLASLIFGLFHCGVSVNTLDTSFSEDEILNMFKYTKPKIIFCDADIYTTVQKSLNILSNPAKIYIVSENCTKADIIPVTQMLEQISSTEAYNFRPNDPIDGNSHIAMIICSSGTTGASKGVCLSHASLIRPHTLEFVSETRRMLCFSSLYWLSGVLTLISGTILGLTRIITDEPFAPELMLDIIDKYKVTTVLTPPSQLAMILQCPSIENRELSSLKNYLCGGSFVSPDLCDEMQNRFPHIRITVGYGSTEITGTSNMNQNPHKRASVGKLMPNLQMKIIDDQGNALGPNDPGEICIKTSYRLLGYCGRSEELASILDSDNWIHSGDIGYIDEDGFLFIVDRKKEILKYKNFHVSPCELENVLLNVPGVSQACVCGIPDPIYTDLPAALIVPKVDANIREKDVHCFMEAKLSDHKQLRGGVYFVDSLPLTPSGKIRRSQIKELAKHLYTKRIALAK